MGDMLLTSDLHLTDKIDDEYRWRIFGDLAQHGRDCKDIFILGDLTDRADRHSAALVNRLIMSLTQLADRDHYVTILCGNHDRPQHGVPYWEFLNHLPYVTFVTEPRAVGSLLLLPYDHHPKETWKNINFSEYSCVFMHQTVSGAMVHGRTLEAPNMATFAANNTVYSGDIHEPQQIGQVTYVGAPYPVKFGDNYKTRMLRLNDEYRIAKEIVLSTIHKDVLEITDLKQLSGLEIPSGSQVRVRLIMPASAVDRWPGEEAAIVAWAKSQGVKLTSAEAIIETSPDNTKQFDFDADPETILRSFCDAEGVDDLIYQTGLQILQSVE
jgi:hypothetical protein